MPIIWWTNRPRAVASRVSVALAKPRSWMAAALSLLLRTKWRLAQPIRADPTAISHELEPKQAIGSNCRDVRPNLIAMTGCKVLSVKEHVIEIESIDAFLDTPVLDITSWQSCLLGEDRLAVHRNGSDDFPLVVVQRRQRT